MRVAAIDVGSNTVRLLVATLEDGSVEPVREERTAVGLAREIERTGRIPDEKIARAAEVARRYARDAAKLGAARIEVLVTAPARQSRNGSELVEAISAATRLPVRPLSAEEEGRLAFAGRGLDLSGAAREHRRRRRRRGLDAARLRHRRGPGLVPDARHRLAAARAAAPRSRPAAEARSWTSSGRASSGRSRATRHRFRAAPSPPAEPLGRCAASSGGRWARSSWRRPRRSSARRRPTSSPRSSASRSGGARPCWRARSCWPRRSGGWACRSSSRARASAKAPFSSRCRKNRPPRQAARGSGRARARRRRPRSRPS